MRRWGEYLTVVATSVFLPWEIYEVTEKITVIRVGALIINIAAVIWLLWSKRLFGIRGGGAAYHAEHSAESLLTVERARGHRWPLTDHRRPGTGGPDSVPSSASGIVGQQFSRATGSPTRGRERGAGAARAGP